MLRSSQPCLDLVVENAIIIHLHVTHIAFPHNSEVTCKPLIVSTFLFFDVTNCRGCEAQAALA